jgi:phage gp36-like protein
MAAAYCLVTDLGLAIRAEALDGLDTFTMQDCIDGAADTIDSYLRSRYALPLRSWGKDIRRCCAILAVYDAMTARGFNPANSGDDQLELRYEKQIQWLRDISNEKASPNVIDASSPASPGTSTERARMQSNIQRGYQQESPSSNYRLPFQGGRRG